MCDIQEQDNKKSGIGSKIMPVSEAVGTVLSHDITEIRPGEFKGRAFKKGHVIRKEDICHLQRLGKENLFILEIKQDEMHENDAAYAIAEALAGSGVKSNSEPKEGKINLAAERDGLLKIDREALLAFNTLGDVMCATIHSNSVVKKGQVVAGTRAIPLVVKKSIVDDAVTIAERGKGIVSVKPMRRPKAGIVITGNEVYYGRVTDAFKPLITMKIREYCGEVVGVYFAPDDAHYIEDRIRELISGGADLIITTGGMSVDPDDVTRFAIRNIGAQDITYGSPVLPGAMFLIAYVRAEEQKSRREEEKNSLTSKLSDFRTSGLIPILGIPACGMYCSTTIFDIVLPRILAGEKIDRKELAELGHGGLCLKCKECRYPVCPFGK
ncbi:MAG: molybdopterin-binding protein [Thermodesulfovibrionia bacterium]|nr:molybdopterin-binding protein [Thermodesulfovibrionia bacterium]